MMVDGATTEPTPTSFQPEIPGQPLTALTIEQESILAFLAAYPHASGAEIAATVAPGHSVWMTLIDLLTRGYVKRSTVRFEGWLAVPWMFDPGPPSGVILDMAELRHQQELDAWRANR